MSRLCVMLVASVGGHLTQLQRIARSLGEVDYFYVVNSSPPGGLQLEAEAILIAHSERDWKVLLNFLEGWQICRRRRPDVIISTGAGQIVPIALVALLFGIPTVFVESMSRVNTPSLTGRLMYRIADRFYYQWPGLKRYFPKAHYLGPLL